MSERRSKKGPALIGYRVVTENLLLGDHVYKKGDFIPTSGVGKDLQCAVGVRLVEPVYEGEEDVTVDEPSDSKSALKTLLPFLFRKV